MRCLVTGASGFLGSHLVSALLERNHIVTVLLRPDSDPVRLRDNMHQVRVLYGSLEYLNRLDEGLTQEPVDAVFHLAWSGVTGDFRNHTAPAMRNVIGSLQLWELLRQHNCKTFIGVGSQAEYGPYAQVLTENLSANPETVYGASKLALCQILKQFCVSVEMRFVWLRLLSLFGPADDERHMVPSLIGALLHGDKPALTACEQVWDYLYVSDAAAALCAVLESNASGIYNLGSGCPCILRDFVSMLRDNIDNSLPLGFGEVPYRNDQVMHLVADISRLTAATGWMPKISTQEGILRTIEWHRRRGDYLD